jgi:hypothetical protein
VANMQQKSIDNAALFRLLLDCADETSIFVFLNSAPKTKVSILLRPTANIVKVSLLRNIISHSF